MYFPMAFLRDMVPIQCDQMMELKEAQFCGKFAQFGPTVPISQHRD